MSGDEPQDNLSPKSQLPLSGRPLTSAHKALIMLLAEIAVTDYLSEKDGK